MEFTQQASKALRDAYLDLYLVASRLLEGQVLATQARGLRAQADASLKAARERLFAAGVPEAWVNEVQLPVVGLVDEAARRSPVEGLSEQWSSLQFPLYGHELVGRIAFEQLEKHRRSPDTPIEVLEIYARCLTLGFQGEYFPHRLEDLKVLHESMRNELNRRMGKAPPLSPDLQLGATLVTPPKVIRPRWVVAIAGLAMLVVAVGLTVLLSIDASRAEKALRAAATGDTSSLEVARPSGAE